jgi:hypothetical protein
MTSVNSAWNGTQDHPAIGWFLRQTVWVDPTRPDNTAPFSPAVLHCHLCRVRTGWLLPRNATLGRYCVARQRTDTGLQDRHDLLVYQTTSASAADFGPHLEDLGPRRSIPSARSSKNGGTLLANSELAVCSRR